MTTVIINPGTGVVKDSSLKEAKINIKKFVLDIYAKPNSGHIIARRCDVLDDGGRYGFTLHSNNRRVEIEMPGLPLDQVRWMEQSQNIWKFPRMYIDGSSWIWKIGINVAFGQLYDKQEEG